MSDARLPRKRPPQRRRALTHATRINGVRVLMTVGYYPDGRPAEIFMRTARPGAGLGELLGTVCIMLSIMLQCGIPLEELLSTLEWGEFAPRGAVADADIDSAESPLDYARQRLLRDHRDGMLKIGPRVALERRFAGVRFENAGPNIPVPTPTRDHTENRLHGTVQKAHIEGVPIFLALAYDRDGRPRALSLRMGRSTSDLDALYQTVGQAITVALEYGLPLEEVIQQLDHAGFRPAGQVTGDPEITGVISPLDYVRQRLLLDHENGRNPAMVRSGVPLDT